MDDYLLINRKTKRAVEFVGDTIRYAKMTPGLKECNPVWPEAVVIEDAEARERAAHLWMAEGKATMEQPA